jgi:hypothetical protein
MLQLQLLLQVTVKLKKCSCYWVCQPRHTVVPEAAQQFMRVLSAVWSAICMKHPRQRVLQRLTCGIESRTSDIDG